MVGKHLLHYKITEKIGQGGMAVVYLARDTRLKRPVATKFLPPHIVSYTDQRKRFAYEAQTAQQLDKLPDILRDIVKKLLAKNTDERFQTSDDVFNAVNNDPDYDSLCDHQRLLSC